MDFNFIAPFNEVVGYGVHATNLAKAIWRKGHGINYYPIEPVTEPIRYPFNEMLTQNLDPDLPTVRLGGAGSRPTFPGSKKIDYMVYEVDKLPESWVATSNQCDEFWTASKWGVDVAKESGITVPVRNIPEGVDTDVFCPGGPMYEAFTDDKFKFLAVGKFEPRKGFDVLFKAFSDAFGDNPDVELIIKADNVFTGIKTPGQILEKALPWMTHRRVPNIRFVGQLANKHELATLYRSCDAFVLPTRGEGWGLPIIESMATGLPVITTNWSGQTEYTTPQNSLLLNPNQLVRANDPHFGATLQQGRWADPSVEELTEKMVALYESPNLQKKLGDQARKDCQEKWTWEHSADRFIEAIGLSMVSDENDRWEGTASIMPD